VAAISRPLKLLGAADFHLKLNNQVPQALYPYWLGYNIVCQMLTAFHSVFFYIQ
jgi:hypothetical protein